MEAGGEIVYDSGRREDVSSLGFEAPVELKPRTRYQWTVTVWGDGGDTATASSWFETAKQEEPWAAQWIAADFADKETQPLLAKSFTLPGEVESARAYACGVGIYELEVNGQKAGDEYLLPGYHCYDFHLEYQTFDITGLLRAGENTVGLALAPGWYKGDIIFDRYHNLYGDTMQAICEIRVKLKDGAEVTIPGRWKAMTVSAPRPPRCCSTITGSASTTTPGGKSPAGARTAARPRPAASSPARRSWKSSWPAWGPRS